LKNRNGSRLRFASPARAAEREVPRDAVASRPHRGGLGGRRDFIAPARAAEVVSSNIVGYEKITITPGLNMIGNQFLSVGGTAFQNINQMFKESDDFVAGASDSEADSILTWNGSSYNNIYYYDDFDYSWYNTDDLSASTTDIVTMGQGVWFKHQGNTSVTTTLAGEVPTNNVFEVTITPGLNFIANPYPMAICPNGEYFSVEGIVAGASDSEADSILTWNGSSYNNIYYYDDWDNNWYNTDDLSNAVSDTILKPAMGFWYKHQGTGATLTFKKPY